MKKVFLFIIILKSVGMFSQTYKVLPLYKELFDKQADVTKHENDYRDFLKKAYDAEANLPGNFVKNGSVDYTFYIQEAINKNDIVKLPNFPILVNTKGIKLKSNSVLLFQNKTKLVIQPNNLTNYEILNLNGVDNVKVYYANIEGDKYTHFGKAGQWGFGISIRGSKNILLIGPQVSKTWGDGIYIGKLNKNCSEQIEIINSVVNDVRRNGISVTCGVNINIVSPLLANTCGNSPKSGLDIEPNTNDDLLDNIIISNPITFNNEWSGILIVLQSLEGVNNKKVSIDIQNHNDIKSRNALSLQGLVVNKYKDFVLDGTVKVNGTAYKQNKMGFYLYKSDLSNLQIETDNQDVSKRISNYRSAKK